MKKIIAGVDEVGRGSLIGPVYAAAVILNKKINTKLLKDSKLLSKQNREKLNIYIKKNSSYIFNLFLFFYLIFGFYLSINTGISTDEFIEQKNWRLNFNQIFHIISTLL